jgi:hypothetical protein
MKALSSILKVGRTGLVLPKSLKKGGPSQSSLPFVFFALVTAIPAASTHASQDFDALITPFIEAHCVMCHGEEKQKGDIRLDTLSRDFSQGQNAVLWQDVSDMLITGDMPPEEEPRPPKGELSQAIKAIDSELRAAAASANEKGRIAIRRLSHSALDNTVKDLLGIDLLLSKHLPADPDLEGFNSLAITLDANPEMVLKLQNNANTIAKLAMASGEDVRQKRHYSLGTIGHGYNVEERGEFIVTSSSRDRKHVMWPQGFVVPQDGLYRVEVDGFARDYRTDLEEQGIEYTYVREAYEKNMKERERKPNDEPRLVSIVAIQASEARHMDAASVPGRRVGYFYIGNELGKQYVDVRLNKGENIMVHYASAAILNQSPTAIVEGKEMLVADLLQVKSITVSGPEIDAWPPPARQRLLGNHSTAAADIHKKIEAFLSEAFRRPVPETTVRNFNRLYQAGLEQGLSEEASMSNVVEGVLTSPRFLYNYDKGDGQDSWAIANRLSYFLWNSMPDTELRKLAEKGQLRKPRVLRQQVLRMLKDEKSERLVKDFTAQWLGLKDIELMRPDPKLYEDYDPLLEAFMAQESEAFFEHVLSKNLSITSFLDSDFAMLNERLARHYEIEGVSGNAFQKVALPKENPRGGLLGQASILKLTSNGTRTSPVVRGVWILENILGDPPSPAPADVEPIEPDVRGTKTIFDMLSRHREVETCADCHKSIDPWGFGLEHFDAIGVYRSKYRNGQPVYAKGSVPGGSFDGVVDMKKVLLDRSDQFARALTEKLLTYALGHPLSFSEKIVADDIAAANLEKGGGFKDLIITICTSPLFRGETQPTQVAQN